MSGEKLIGVTICLKAATTEGFVPFQTHRQGLSEGLTQGGGGGAGHACVKVIPTIH